MTLTALMFRLMAGRSDKKRDAGLTIPETNVDLCVGCGGCEYICPARPHRAIYIEGNPEHVQATPPPKEETVEVEEVDFGF